jgi:endonuclease/exonuclease/phosphatase family metal-dependent hydrolase
LKHFYTIIVSLFLTLASVAQQTESITVMTYNLLNYRVATAQCSFSVNNPILKEGYQKTIAKHVMPDILVCNEIGGGSATNGDFILTNVLNTDGVNYYAKASYSNNGFSNLVNMMYYDSRKFSLTGQAVISKDLNNNDLVRVIDVYRLYYKDSVLTNQSDTVFFWVIAAHLKAGNTGADATERTNAAAAVMNYVQTNLASKNVILCGDMNIYKSQEAAYQNFTNWTVASARFYDPVNAPGNWSNDAAFAALHTQSTRSGNTNSGCFSSGGLDDRLDHILISNEVRDNVRGMEYVPNSYFALGNDGNHLNQEIISGTNFSVPAPVLTAIYNSSDHLPVIAEFALKRQQLGVPEISAANLVFENPISDKLTVTLTLSSVKNPELRLLDLTGKIVAQSNMQRINQDWESTLDVSALPVGIYLIEVNSAQGNIVKKVVKQ